MMLQPILFAVRLRSNRAAAWAFGLIAFVVVANGWGVLASDSEEFANTIVSTLAGPVFANPATASPPAANYECAPLATVRWFPHSTLTIGFTRGDFTDKERAAFHKAIRLWQQALDQTDVGITLYESGETDAAVPAQGQIIVKRDNSIDEGHYGKIVAFARRDNYLERALILIKGSLHKRDDLRKALSHELGHGFGLRDCPECRSGVTVMNYFSQTAIMGLRVRGGSSKIAKQPTVSDISQVLSGYRQSRPPALENGADESADASIIVANAVLDLRDKDGDMTAPYLKQASARDYANRKVAPYLNPVSETDSAVPFVKLSWKQDLSRLSLPGQMSERGATSPLAFLLFPKPQWKRAAGSFSPASFLWTVSEKQEKPAATALEPTPRAENSAVSVIASPPESKLRSEPKTATDLRASESGLSEKEKTEFESYVPKLLKTEAQTMKELNSYTFRREVRIQTLDSKGRVSGEYYRISDMLFDDLGGRIERGVSSSEPTLRRLKISPEYVEDFSGAQLKGFELSKQDHYRIEPFMTDTTDGARMRVYRMTPLNLNAERAAHARVFYGFVWVDEATGKIVKLRGCALPDDKQRYPLFETQRELIDGVHLFPARTIADDYLVFPSHTVHMRMSITYTNYKKFASRVTITEVDGQ